MNILLWLAQGLLALAFLLTGLPKATMPIPLLAKRLPWTAHAPVALVRFIGIAEILGAIGVVVPDALYALGVWKANVFPSLTIAAAVGLALVMVSAAGFHLIQREGPHSAPSVVLLLLALVVIVGRLAWAPIG